MAQLVAVGGFVGNGDDTPMKQTVDKNLYKRSIVIFGWISVYILNEFYKQYLWQSPLLFYTIDFIEFVIIPIVCVSYLRKFDLPTTKESLRTKFSLLPYQVADIYLLVFIVSAAIAYVDIPRTDYLPTKSSTSHILDGLRDSGYSALVFLYLAITAGVVEEFLYRKYLTELLEEFRLPKAAIIHVSSGLFALAHWEQNLSGMAQAYVFGYIFSLYFVANRRIGPLMVTHALYDFHIFMQHVFPE